MKAHPYIQYLRNDNGFVFETLQAFKFELLLWQYILTPQFDFLRNDSLDGSGEDFYFLRLVIPRRKNDQGGFMGRFQRRCLRNVKSEQKCYVRWKRSALLSGCFVVIQALVGLICDETINYWQLIAYYVR